MTTGRDPSFQAPKPSAPGRKTSDEVCYFEEEGEGEESSGGFARLPPSSRLRIPPSSLRDPGPNGRPPPSPPAFVPPPPPSPKLRAGDASGASSHSAALALAVIALLAVAALAAAVAVGARRGWFSPATHEAPPAAPETGFPAATESAPPPLPPSLPSLPSLPPPGPPENIVLDLGGGVVLETALIPAGRFMMGSPPAEAFRGEDELSRAVTITRPFHLGRHEVTQAQYEAVMGKNPSAFKGEKRPVENVSWFDAADFCRRASERTGRTVRLPTEAEWEYACRAGTTGPFSVGASIAPDQANYNSQPGDADGYAGVHGGRTGNVDAFRPNAWGLFNMHGNVQEWCADGYAPYPPGPATDPRGPPGAERRVLRGGGWRHPPEKLRSARRGESPPEGRGRDIGFRVAVEVRTGE